MIKKLIFSLTSAVAVLAGCVKMPSISDQPFTIGIKSVQAQAVWADVVPESNDFDYGYGTVTVQDYERKYGSDEALIKAKDSGDKEFWEQNLKGKISFRDAYLCNGAYFLKGYPLEPETDYYVYAFPYDQDDNPICKVVKQRFRTSSLVPSQIDFTITLQGSVITVTPSVDETYYFDYDSVESINRDFMGDASVFYNYLLYKYEEYGFMPEMICRGQVDSDIAEYFTLEPGQEFYLVGSGYNNGVNSPLRIFKLKYNGSDQPGSVETCK